MNKCAIFIGSITEGFGISQIVEAEAAEDIVIAHLANGKMAEAVKIQKPSSLYSRDFDSGMDFVVFGSGLGNGFTMYGPFPDFEVANEFAEEHRGEDEEWEHLQYDASAPHEKLKTSRFDQLFETACEGLRAFYPNLTDAAMPDIKLAVQQEYVDTGNDQQDYEKLKDAIETAVESLPADDPADDAHEVVPAG